MSSEDGHHLFPTTHWTLVARAGADRSVAQREALGDLLRRYEGAFHTFLTARYRLPPDRAADLVQGFVLSRVLERNLITRADAGRGKFRTFVMRALEQYAIDQFRRASAKKRRVDRAGVDVQDYQDSLADPGAADPARAFDLSWASQAVRQAVEQMRRTTEPVRPDLWGVFADRVLGPAFDSAEPTAYADLIGRLGFADEAQASSALKTSKRIFARVLRGVVSEYARTADEVDREVDDLRAVLAGR